MKATEILVAEHALISRYMLTFKEKLSRPQLPPKTDYQHFISFVREYVDKFHHAKEEDIYFVWMKECRPELEFGPLKCMLKEHDLGRALIVKADSLIGENNLSKANEYILEFIILLEEHIEKENTVLYKMADNIDHLQGGGDENLLPSFEKVQEKLARYQKRYSTI